LEDLMRTVKVRITRSFNVGNYESIKPEVELEGNALDVDLPQTASFQEIFFLFIKLIYSTIL
jgi:hypothetical protein